uniref:ATP-binding cassette domain-containing protein n=1 Tax=Pseudomonas sp. EA_65y_Pfl1_P113 TaxID=3088692 RepID=UPI0030DDBDA4
MSILQARDLAIRFGGIKAVDGITFDVAQGEIFTIIGPNGAGKTTLTRVLAGEALPAAGSVRRTGELGYLPQDPRDPDMETIARARILSARGLDHMLERMRTLEHQMANGSEEDRAVAMDKYAKT